MGIGIGVSRAHYPSGPILDRSGPYTPPSAPNPDPRNFKWVSHVEIGPYVIATIRYPACTTYEGVKIIVYKAPLAVLKAQKHLDPHFQESGLAPLARFEPTLEGLQAAIILCNALLTKTA